MKKKKTRKDYEDYLNGLGIGYDSFIIGGLFRKRYYPNRYGSALRKYDPVAFNVGYNEYLSN